MNKLIAIAATAVALCFGTAARAAEATYHHVHNRATDPKATAEWYTKYMGGRKLGDCGGHLR